MERIETKDVVYLCGKVGQILLTNGAETPRVEETVEYIGRSAKLEISCYATLNAVFVAADDAAVSHFVKVELGGFNLQKVDEINKLSRAFHLGEISFEKLEEQVDQVAKQVIDFSWKKKLIGAGLVSIAPFMLFKMTYSDFVVAFFTGIIGYMTANYVGEKIGTPYIKEASGGFVVAILALIVTHMGFGMTPDSIIICSLMPLVPGVAITNSIREIIDRHIIAGIMRGVDAVLTAGAIGAGVIIGTSLIEMIQKYFGG